VSNVEVSGNGGGCLGCMGFIICVVIIWALIFGVTIGGKHYGISSCSTEKGVQIDK
jgi:hypothetical protein